MKWPVTLGVKHALPLVAPHLVRLILAALVALLVHLGLDGVTLLDQACSKSLLSNAALPTLGAFSALTVTR